MKKRIRITILFKAILMMFMASVILVEIPIAYFSLATSNTNQKNYRELATNISNTFSEVIDVTDFSYLKDKVKTIVDNSSNKPTYDQKDSEAYNIYIAQFNEIKNDQHYIDTLNRVNRMQNINTDDLRNSLLSYVDTVNKLNVCILDTAKENPIPTGTLFLLKDDEEVLSKPSKGFAAYTSRDNDGHYFASAGAPIYLDDNTVEGYITITILMDSIRNTQRDDIIKLFIYLFASVTVLGIISFIIIHLFLLKPIKELNTVANSYDSHHPEKTHERFSKLNVKTHDELYELSLALKRMENDSYEKLQELLKKNEELAASQRQTERMRALAHKDPLTGVRNKNGYKVMEDKINQDIKEGKNMIFGVAMIDLNDLKIINDQYGHDAGDIALIRLSNIICSTFVHSPVFRFGGDEFVVILRNTDFAKSEMLIKEFNDKISAFSSDEELQPAERVSAALGYAVYDATIDNSVEDVFKRADEAMYKRKREMKRKD